MPIAVVSIRDSAGIWKNHLHGLGVEWERRELPFIEETLAAETMFTHCGQIAVPDGVTFYAGLPLRHGPFTLGILAVMDVAPREITLEQSHMLLDLSAVVRHAVVASLGDNIQASRISHSAASMAMRVDLTGRISRIDPQTEQRLGWGSGSLIGRHLSEIVEPTESALATDGLLAQLGSSGPLASNLRLITSSGERLLVRAQTRLAFDQGTPAEIEFEAHDFSSEAVRMQALLQVEQALSQKADELARFSEHLRQLHRLATAEYANLNDVLNDHLRTGCEILRMPLGLVTSLAGAYGPIRAVYPKDAALSPASILWVERLLSAASHQERTSTYPFDTKPLYMPLESSQPLLCCISTPIYAGDDLFGTLSFGSNLPEDVRRFSAHEQEVLELMAKSLGRYVYEDHLRRERTRLTIELARQAQQDPLTGLANRLQFVKHLESALAKATQNSGTLGVAFLDLDRFKQVNDTLGHSAGDEILRQVAARLQREISQDESVARVGGDEFTILFSANPTRARVGETAQKVLDALRAPYPVNTSELFITGTLGIAMFPEDGSDARDLLQKADAAMYRAKSQGKNDYRFFTPDIVIRGSSRMELETELRRALEKGELRMGFMPLVCVKTSTLSSFEALLAWSNPRFGNVGASRFIPIAEESGMIIPIGAWVLNEVCRQVASWQALGLRPVRVAINVSPLQFSRPEFVDTVSTALRQSGLPPQCLELELTESMIMRDVDSAARRMSQLRDVGVSIAIDDFGTGYSSLSYLRRLPVDTLKIDQSFVAELGSTGTALPLIHTIVVLAHNIGLTVVAEGVESREQLDLLRAAGCDNVQGHLFGEPLTACAVQDLMRRPSRDVPFVR